MELLPIATRLPMSPGGLGVCITRRLWHPATQSPEPLTTTHPPIHPPLQLPRCFQLPQVVNVVIPFNQEVRLVQQSNVGTLFGQCLMAFKLLQLIGVRSTSKVSPWDMSVRVWMIKKMIGLLNKFFRETLYLDLCDFPARGNTYSSISTTLNVKTLV